MVRPTAKTRSTRPRRRSSSTKPKRVDHYIRFDDQKVRELQAQSLVDELAKLGKKDPQIIMINGSPTDNNVRLFKMEAHSDWSKRKN